MPNHLDIEGTLDHSALRPAESDPNGKRPQERGAKLDAGKPQVARGALRYFPRAIMAVATVSEFGARKYCWDGWRDVDDALNRYENAAERHTLYEAIEGPYDQDTTLLHAAHRAWNALAVLEKLLEEGAPLHNPESPNAV